MSTGSTDQDGAGAARSGLYRTSGTRTPPAEAGLDVVRVSLAGAAHKAALLERFAAALAFPDWFGANWDALEDCLSDLSWREDRDRLLLIEGFEPLAASAGDDFRVLLDLLREVAEHWAAQGRAFRVVFVDPGHRLALPSWRDASA
ncbi:MAG: barstar family protein [Burkholderiales bacterium]|nr:barstar family protein [Burkholderiales bacterium]